MNILILGGTGSIGAALVNILKTTNWNVAVTSRKAKDRVGNVTYIEGNAHEKMFLKECLHKEKWDAIVDFMAYTTKEFSERYELFLKNTNQYFFLSSSRVYAESDSPITENSARLLDVCSDEEYLKTDEYALAKARQENLLLHQKTRIGRLLDPIRRTMTIEFSLGCLKKRIGFIAC